MSGKRLTLKNVALEAGVHVSTVSRALDPHTRHPVTPEVAARVREVAARLGYRPNRIAAGLRTNRTMTVGVLIPDIANVIFPPIVRGLESVLEPNGYAPIIVNTDNDPRRERRLLSVLRERGVDGLIHAAVLRDDPFVAEAAQSGLVIVTLNRKVDDPAIPCVVNDERGGVARLVRHLTDLGHRRIAHLAGPQSLSTGRTRLEAFLAETAARGLPTPDELLVVADRFDEAEGARRVAELVERRVPFSALLAANDLLALGALRRLRELGWVCPRDVSVTGYNDMPFLDMIPPRLTTVRIGQFEAGREAARILLRAMRDRQAAVDPETVLPVSLVVGESTAPPRVDLRSAG